MRDIANSLHVLPAIAPVVATDNTALVSAIIDLQGYGGAMFAIATGTLADADATFTVLLEEGDAANLSDAAAVADADLIGLEATASFTYANDGVTRKLGYIGAKRYVRLTITPAANSGNAPICAMAILGRPMLAPTPNPPL